MPQAGMLYYENRLKAKGLRVIIGVDEAGRGPLAGPVVAAAARLKTYDHLCRIDDSKKLSAAQREAAFREIRDKSDFCVASVGHKTIDRINILKATQSAMKKAVLGLAKEIGPLTKNDVHVIVDGDIELDIPFGYTRIIRGDAKSKSIAAASILAKVTRDRMMERLDRRYPQYGFARHKGYPTAEHRDAIKKFGLTCIHRRSFSHA